MDILGRKKAHIKHMDEIRRYEDISRLLEIANSTLDYDKTKIEQLAAQLKDMELSREEAEHKLGQFANYTPLAKCSIDVEVWNARIRAANPYLLLTRSPQHIHLDLVGADEPLKGNALQRVLDMLPWEMELL